MRARFYTLSLVALTVVAPLLLHFGMFSRSAYLARGRGKRATEKDLSVLLAGTGKSASFERNEGQTDPAVAFLWRGQKYDLFLTHGAEAVLRVASGAGRESSSAADIAGAGATDLRIAMNLVGSNRAPTVQGKEALPSWSNYFLGNNSRQWQTKVAHYARVEYQGVYDGVDLAYYGREGQLEYDFRCAPGVDPKVIRLGFSGVEGLRVNERGDAILKVAGGELAMQAAYAYQEAAGRREAVRARYVLQAKGELGFAVEEYDHTRAVILDPVLVYSNYLHGNGTSEANSIAVGPDGSVYLVGTTTAADFPAASPELRPKQKGDAFVVKINQEDSSLVWSAYLGGNDLDEGRAIAIDAAGQVYVAGRTLSVNFPVENGFQGRCSETAEHQCSGDAFIAKLSAEGELLNSSYLGGSGDDAANAIAVDASGDVYVAGRTASTDFPVFKAIQPSTGGEGDGFVTEIASDWGSFVYSTYLGGRGADEINGMTVDIGQSVYVAGSTHSPDFPTKGAMQSHCKLSSTSECTGDAFVTKIGPQGKELIYSTYLGGSGDDAARAIVVDALGEAYVTGYTESADFPRRGAMFDSPQGGRDAFVAKLDSGGEALVYSTYLGGSAADEGKAIALDEQGNTYVAGTTHSANFPLQNALGSSCHTGSGGQCLSTAVISVLGTTGKQLLFSTYLTSNGAEEARGIALDADGAVYVAGATTTGEFTVKAAQFPTSAVGDGFVAKMTGLVPPGPATKKPPLTTVSCTGTISWTGSKGDGQWTTVGNWNLGRLPGASDDVCIGSAFASKTVTLSSGTQSIRSIIANSTFVFSSGTLTIANASQFANAFTLSGGTLNGNANVTISGLLTWSSGIMSASTTSATTTSNGGISFNSSGVELDFRTLVNGNSQTANFTTTGGMSIGDGATLSNPSGSTFNVQADQFFGGFGTSPGGTISNGGIFTKSAGAVSNSTTFSNLTFNSTGTVNVNAGNLSVNDGGTSPGTFNIATQTSISFASGTFTFDKSTFGGAGTVNFNGGNCSFSAPYTYNITGATSISAGTLAFNSGSGANLTSTGDLTLSNGTLGGTQNMTVPGVFTWTGGTLNGAATTTVNGGIILDGSPTLDTRTVINANSQTMNWVSTGGIFFTNGAVFSNPAGSTVSDLNDQFSEAFGANATGFFNNAGTFVKSVGNSSSSTIFTNGLAFNNTGTVTVSTGNLNLGAGGTSPGKFTVSAGAALTFGASGNTLTSSSISGAGTVNFSGGTDTFNAPYTYNVTGNTVVNGGAVTFAGGTGATITSVGALSVSSSTITFTSGKPVLPTALNVSSGTLTGTDPITVSGPLVWTGGTISGFGTVTINGGITLNGSLTLDTKTLVNANKQTLTWTGTSGFFFTNGAVFSNPAGSTVSDLNDQFSEAFGANATGFFNNAGTFVKSVGNSSSSTTFTNGLAFNNTGTVTVSTGNLNLNAGGTSPGKFAVSTGAALTFGGGGNTLTSSSISGAGTVNFSGGTDTFNAPYTYNVTGNTVVNGGTVSFAGGTGATITSIGALSISFSTLTFTTGKAVLPTALNQSSGTLTGTDSITVSGPSVWTGGTISGTGTLTANGGITLNGSITLDTKTLINGNSQTMNWVGNGGISFTNGSVFSNPAGSVINDLNDQFSSVFGANPTGTFNNAGTFTKTVGLSNLSTTFNSGITFLNTGTVNANRGTLTFNGTFSQTAGSTVLHGGNISSSTTLNFTGGNLLGAGRITGNVSNASQVSPGFSGAPGLMTIVGNYTQTAGGTLNIEVGGTTAGKFDQLFVSGTATLAGTLNVKACATIPLPATSLLIMTFTSSSGSFGTVNGLTAVPAVSLSGASVSFSPQVTGIASTAQSVTLTNNSYKLSVATSATNLSLNTATGTAPLTITSITASGNFATPASGTPCPLSPSTLAANTSCIINITFNPAAPQAYSGVITIVTNDMSTPEFIGVSGTGLAPLSVSPSSLAFNSVAVGSTSAAQVVTLTNNGAATLTIGFSASAEYSAVAGGGAGPACTSSLAGGAHCTVSVTFKPKSNGLANGSMSATNNVSFSPVNVALSGTGTGGLASPLTFTGSLSFTNIAVGQTSPGTTITVTNSSASSVTLSGLSASGNFSAVGSGATPCGSGRVLGSSASCTMTVTFSPTIPGNVTGGVAVADNTSVSPQVLNATGAAVLPITLAPPSLSFGAQAQGTTSAPQTVTVTNHSGATVTINSIKASGQFTATAGGGIPCGASLAGGASCTFVVTFTPNTGGAIPGVVTVSTTAALGPQEEPLAGTGILSCF